MGWLESPIALLGLALIVVGVGLRRGPRHDARRAGRDAAMRCCPRAECGHPNEPQAHYCGRCGARLDPNSDLGGTVHAPPRVRESTPTSED
ncbi:MAG: zinc ribbon domain-containing protein [Phycisphaerae bacterium]|nr:zinc ribbon domain-containing protein [Phycisphaerae bacterium]